MVSDRCTVGAGCAVDSRETLLTGTVIHSRECHRYTKKLPTQVSNNNSNGSHSIRAIYRAPR